MNRVRVGVIGCGMVAQLMHLPYLRELRERYELAALCDISHGTLDAVAEVYGVERRHTDWRDLLEEDLDAVLILTNASHAEPAVEAARRGLHVFVEKPLCFTLAEADRMIDAAETNGVRLMVGYMKRYDPGFVAASARVPAIRDLRFVRATTLEAPPDDYVAPYQLLRVDDVPADAVARFAAERSALVEEAIGPRPGPDLRRAYVETLLDSAIHELNVLRALLGEPVAVLSAEFWDAGRSVHVVFAFEGELRAALSWITLPELRRYRQEIVCYGPAQRLAIAFPSPYLRNAPTPVTLEEQDATATWERELVAGYEEAFRAELLHFHACVTEGAAPRTDARDARRDVALAQAIVRAAVSGTPARLEDDAGEARGRASAGPEPSAAAVEAGR